MPRTRAQRRGDAAPPLGGLNDDARCDGADFPLSIGQPPQLGGASKAMRAVATSNELARLRGSESYVLRGSDHGVVHALATALGTQPWRRVALLSKWTINPGHKNQRGDATFKAPHTRID